jgi:parallel beta-helix repeat protein
MKTQDIINYLLTNIQFLLLGLIFATHSTVAFAYTPPIGIPDPGMWGGIHPIEGSAPDIVTKCSGWPSAQVTGCYYIDNTHSQATDTSNTNGYPGKPRRTLPDNTFAAGSYIEIHGGPYTDKIVLKMHGTSGSPVWFRGSSSNMPVFTNSFEFRDSSYLFVEHLDFNGGLNGCINIMGESTHHILVRNSKFRNRTWTGNTAAVGITPHPSDIMHDIVVYNNEFSELGDWEAEADQDFHGINPDTYGRTPPTELYNVWMLNNSFYHLSGNGVQVNANSVAMTPNLHHMYIGKNTGHANRQAVLWSKQGSHIIMSQNTCYDNRVHGLQPGNGIGYQYNPDNLWIIFNAIYDSSNGIRQSDTQTDLSHNVYIIGNKIYDIHPGVGESYSPTDFFRPGQAIALWQGGVNRYIVDNTIFDVHGGIMLNYAAPTNISGNIISNIYASDFHVSNNNAQAVTTLDHNMFYPSARFKWSANYTSLSAFTSATGKCTVGCSEDDPEFTNTSTYDLTLQETSPAIGVGTRHVAYATFESLYGINIDVDYNGNPRPANGSWSVGAFEVGTLKTEALPAVGPGAFPRPTLHK